MLSKPEVDSKLFTSGTSRMRALTVLSLTIPIVLQICIIALLLRRKLQKRFPWFFVYVCYALFEAGIRLAASHSQKAYLIAYWSTAVPDLAFTILTLRESFLAIFWSETKLRWFRWIFWACIAIVVGYAGLGAWLNPSQGLTRLSLVIVNLELGVQYVIAAVGLIYFGSIWLFRVFGHQRESGIIWGFGMKATLIILGVYAGSIFGTKLHWLITWLPALAYIIAEVAWTTELLRGEQMIPQPTASLKEMSDTIESYIAILHRYLGTNDDHL